MMIAMPDPFLIDGANLRQPKTFHYYNFGTQNVPNEQPLG